jgi:hypothetical protein
MRALAQPPTLQRNIAHYQKIVVALHETIKIMNQIDETIEAHGGSPAAFTTESPKEV